MANRLLTWEEVEQSFAAAWHGAVESLPSEMFIEGQYNWERPEFDEHG